MKIHSLAKHEKLKSRKIITDLFHRGKSVFVYPIKLVYIKIDEESIQKSEETKPVIPALFTVSVPKKLFKKAVERNSVKRQVREQYRIVKPELYKELEVLNIRLGLMYIYIGKTKEDTKLLPKTLQSLHKKLTIQIKSLEEN